MHDLSSHHLSKQEIFNHIEQYFSQELAENNGEINGENTRYFFAPGRVNLIGEYTDFNGGFVLPCAIQYGTYLIVHNNSVGKYRFYSGNCPEAPQISLDQLKSLDSKQKSLAWANYPIGVLKAFENEIDQGLDFYFYGNIPLGSGLSSSASIEVLTAYALHKLFDTSHSLKDLALLSQRAENQFIGLNCGIMDPYSIALGESDKALMIECQKETHQSLALDMGELAWMIIDSRKSRQLHESKYNERAQECQSALTALQQAHKLNQLCQLTPEQFERSQHLIKDPIVKKRARHVIHEHQRVLDAAQCFESQDWQKLAELLKLSQQSLSQDFEVSGEVLDSLVKITQNAPGVLGSRMTGAGFGGCTISLIKKEAFHDIQASVKEAFLKASGFEAKFYIAEASQGVHEVQVESTQNGQQP